MEIYAIICSTVATKYSLVIFCERYMKTYITERSNIYIGYIQKN